MFKQLVHGDPVFKKTCLKKVERLIRDDYLKLDLEQFVTFIVILGDRDINLSDYLEQLLSENFFMSNATLIARYFVPLIVHINGYKVCFLGQICKKKNNNKNFRNIQVIKLVKMDKN